MQLQPDSWLCKALVWWVAVMAVVVALFLGLVKRRREIESGNERFAVFDLVIEKTVSFDFGKLAHGATPSR